VRVAPADEPQCFVDGEIAMKFSPGSWFEFRPYSNALNGDKVNEIFCGSRYSKALRALLAAGMVPAGWLLLAGGSSASSEGVERSAPVGALTLKAVADASVDPQGR